MKYMAVVYEMTGCIKCHIRLMLESLAPEWVVTSQVMMSHVGCMAGDNITGGVGYINRVPVFSVNRWHLHLGVQVTYVWGMVHPL